MTSKKFLAVDIGGTKISINLFDRTGWLAQIRENTEKTGEETAIPKQIIALSKKICQDQNLSIKNISGVGVSSCGPFVYTNKEISLAGPNICGGLSKNNCLGNSWKVVPLEKVLKKYFNNLVIKNDCVAAAKAEKLFGHGKNEDNFIYVTWSTGVGTGAYVDGKLLSGKNANAPHLGHIIVDPKSKNECGCGGYGHLEGETSGTALEKQFGKKAEELFKEYKNKNPKAIKIINRATKNFAQGLSAINSILDNKLFIIGGSVFTNNKDILLPLLKKEFSKLAYVPLAQGVEIKSSALGEAVADFGAASLIMPKEYTVHFINNNFLQR